MKIKTVLWLSTSEETISCILARQNGSLIWSRQESSKVKTKLHQSFMVVDKMADISGRRDLGHWRESKHSAIEG